MSMCTPQSHTVTAQPCSPAHAVLLAAHSLHPSCSWGAALLDWCIFRCPRGLVGFPQVSQHGDSANLAQGEGGTAQNLWLLRKRGCIGGRMTQERR